MSITAISFNSTEMRKKKANQNLLIKTSRSNYENTKKLNESSSDDDSFILTNTRSSNSNLAKNKNTNNLKSNTNPNSNSLKKSKTNTQLTDKRNNENNIQIYSDSESSDIQFTNKKPLTRPNNFRHLNRPTIRAVASNNINRGKKTSNNIKFSSSESSDSLRVKKTVNTYRTVNHKPNDSDSDSFDRLRKYQNTIDTVLESDNSDDIPFLESIQEEPEIDFKFNRKSYVKNESNENFQNEIEKVPLIEATQKNINSKNSNEIKQKSNEITHQEEKSDEINHTSTLSDNLNTEQNKNLNQSKSKHNHNGIVRTKHFHTNDKYKKQKKKENSSIQISFSNSEEESKNEPENEVEKNNQNENENKSSRSNSQNEKEQSQSNSQNENENNSDKEIIETQDKNIQEEFDKGVTDEKEIKQLCSLFMKRLPGYKIPNNLIPYKMHTDTKMSFHGKKAKFTLFRGDVPLLSAKLKNKSGSDPIVNIFKYSQTLNSKKEKKKDKSKNKEKEKTKSKDNKVAAIAIVLTGSNFSTFSLRKNESKSEIKSDELSAIHNLYGPGFSKELMTVNYTMPKNEFQPRRVNIHFNDPPDSIPAELSNRKPKFSYGSTCILDIGGRVAKRSIKNCIMVDENNNDIMSIMKIHESEISIEVFPAISELCVFAFGISSVLCKL